MELQVNPVSIPDSITFNYEELKTELAATLKRYEGLVYTPDQLKAAKADRAALNKLKKALNDERIKREKEYMQPFMDFKGKIAELISLIDKPVTLIDGQVKAFEEKKKAEKKAEIKKMFENDFQFPAWLEFDRIFKDVWYNAYMTPAMIHEELGTMEKRFVSDLAALCEMPAFSFEAVECYKQTLDLQTAIAEGKRLLDIQKRKEEAERLKDAEATAEEVPDVHEYECHVEEVAEIGEGVQVGGDLPPVVVAGQWISFKAFLTIPQAKELRAFFKQRGIDFKPIM